MFKPNLASENDRLNVLISFYLPKKYLDRILGVSARIEVNQSRDQEELLKLVENAEVLFAGRFSQKMFLAARKLKWIQTNYVGVESFLYPEVVGSDVVVTNAGGVNTIQLRSMS